MMHNRTFLLMLFVLLGYGNFFAQTNIIVAMSNGDEYVEQLSVTTRITFANDSISIGSRLEADSLKMFSLANVSKLFFTDNTVTGLKVVEDYSILMCPNPVCDYFTLKGILGENSLSIYSIGGTEMLRKQYKSGEKVDVSWLKPGSYIIRVGKCVGKFTKR